MIFKKSLIVGVTSKINAGIQNKFLFNNVAPLLQIHGLMCIEAISNSSEVRRYIITDKGQKLLAYIATK